MANHWDSVLSWPFLAIQRQFLNFHDRPTQTSIVVFQTLPVFEIHLQRPGKWQHLPIHHLGEAGLPIHDKITG